MEPPPLSETPLLPPLAPGGQAGTRVLLGCALMLMLLALFLGAALVPRLETSGEAARANTCLANVRQISAALQMYAQDYDDRLPRAAEWMDATIPYIKNNNVFQCPTVQLTHRSGYNFDNFGQPHDGYGYALNNGLSGREQKKIPNPASTLQVYDSVSTFRNTSDAVNSLPKPGRHQGRNLIGYVDGHAAALGR